MGDLPENADATIEERAIALGYNPEIVPDIDRTMLTRAVTSTEETQRYMAEQAKAPHTEGRTAETPEQMSERIRREHIALQEANKRRNGHE